MDSNWGPSAYQPNALLLGQTSSQDAALAEIIYIYQLYYLQARELKKLYWDLLLLFLIIMHMMCMWIKQYYLLLLVVFIL